MFDSLGTLGVWKWLALALVVGGGGLLTPLAVATQRAKALSVSFVLVAIGLVAWYVAAPTYGSGRHVFAAAAWAGAIACVVVVLKSKPRSRAAIAMAVLLTALTAYTAARPARVEQQIQLISNQERALIERGESAVAELRHEIREQVDEVRTELERSTTDTDRARLTDELRELAGIQLGLEIHKAQIDEILITLEAQGRQLTRQGAIGGAAVGDGAPLIEAVQATRQEADALLAKPLDASLGAAVDDDEAVDERLAALMAPTVPAIPSPGTGEPARPAASEAEVRAPVVPTTNPINNNRPADEPARPEGRLEAVGHPEIVAQRATVRLRVFSDVDTGPLAGRETTVLYRLNRHSESGGVLPATWDPAAGVHTVSVELAHEVRPCDGTEVLLIHAESGARLVVPLDYRWRGGC